MAAEVKVEPAQTRLAKELKHTSPLVGCRFDPSGKYVFASAQDNTLQRWEIDTGKKVAFAGHKSWVRGLAFCKASNTLFSADYTGKILAWDAAADKPEPARTVEAHAGWVRALAVSPDQKLLASCGNDNMIRLWSVSDGTLVRELAGHACHVYNLAFHPSGTHLTSIDHLGNVKVWNVARGADERTLDAKILHKYDQTFAADIGGARGMTFSPNGKTLACAGFTNVSNAFAGVGEPLIVLFDWASGKQSLLKPAKAFRGTAWGVVWHPSGHVIGVGGGNGGELWFWKADQEKALFTLKLPNNARDLDLHPGNQLVAIPFFDGAVRLYDVTAKK